MSIPIGGGYSGSDSRGAVSAAARVNFGWITESWQLFMAQAGVWIAATLALMAPSVVLIAVLYGMIWVTMFPHGFPPPVPKPGMPFPAPPPNPMFLNGGFGKIFTVELVFGLLIAVYSAFIYGGMFRMAVRQVRGLPLTYRDIFAGGPLFGRMLGAMFLLGFATYGLEAVCLGPGYLLTWRHFSPVASFLAFLVGGLLVFCLFLVLTGLLLPSFALMADGVKVFTALRRSVRAMKGSWLSATGFVFVLGLLVYASEIPCGLGLLATMPMVVLMTALAYRDMAGMPDVLPPLTPAYPPAAPGVWPPPPTI